MQVLVDSSIWIDYFKGGVKSNKLDYLIDENLIVTNKLILAELIPFLKLKNQLKVISLLESVNRFEMNIDWQEITEYQYRCIQNGFNGIGLPDLIIAQNAKQNHSEIYTLDKHFSLIKDLLDLELTI